MGRSFVHTREVLTRFRPPSFIVDTYRSLYLCLLDLAVHGSITVLVKGIEEAQEFVTDAISGVRTAIQSSINGIETALDKTVGLIDKIPGCVRVSLAAQLCLTRFYCQSQHRHSFA